nr:immunoglobulin light chain junction region [Macaca mulatta]
DYYCQVSDISAHIF